MNVQNFRRRFMVGSVPEKELSVSTTYIEFVTPAPGGVAFYTYLDGDPTTEGITITSSNTNYITISKYSNSIDINCKGNKDTTSAKDIIVTVKYMSQTIIVTCHIPADYVVSTESVVRESNDYYLTSVDLIPQEYPINAASIRNMRLTDRFWLHYIISQVRSGATKKEMASNTTIYTDGYFDSFINSIVLQYWGNPETHSPCLASLSIDNSSTNNQLKAKWGDSNKSITGTETDIWWGDAKSYGYSHTLFDVEPHIYLTVPKSPPTVNIIGIDGTISQYYVGSSVIKFIGDEHSQSARFKIYTGVRSDGYPTYVQNSSAYLEVTLPIYGTGGSTSTEGTWYWPGEGFTTQ